MTFKPIVPEHPFLTDLNGMNDKDHLYQPMDKEWPIYNVVVHKLETGFNVVVFIKRNSDAWWETCNYFNPIPFELAPIIKDLL